MTAQIIPLRPQIHRFTYTVIMENGTRIKGQSAHEYSADLVDQLLDEYPFATRISVIKETI